MQQKNSRVVIKFFLGYPISTDVKWQLNHSKAWKQASLIKNQENNRLIIKRYSDLEYVGHYMEKKTLTIAEIKKKSCSIAALIAQFLPEFNPGIDEMIVFPEVFVS